MGEKALSEKISIDNFNREECFSKYSSEDDEIK
jgi:hypothetical protein